MEYKIPETLTQRTLADLIVNELKIDRRNVLSIDIHIDHSETKINLVIASFENSHTVRNNIEIKLGNGRVISDPDEDFAESGIK